MTEVAYESVEEALPENSKSYYGEQKQVKVEDFGIQKGAFAFISNEKDNLITCKPWVQCRESFHYADENGTAMRHMVFACTSGRSLNVAAFINKIEQNLGHKNISKFGPTNNKRVMWVEPADFWLKHAVRRNLFTCLLRAGNTYIIAKDNFDEALKGDVYLSSTIPAVKWFLAGNTWPLKDVGAWRDFIGNAKTEDAFKKLLQKKPVSPKELFAYALKLANLTPTTVVEELKKSEITNDVLFNFALTKLKLTKKDLEDEYTKQITSQKAQIAFVLSKLKVDQESLEEKYRHSFFTHTGKEERIKLKEILKKEKTEKIDKEETSTTAA